MRQEFRSLLKDSRIEPNGTLVLPRSLTSDEHKAFILELSDAIIRGDIPHWRIVAMAYSADDMEVPSPIWSSENTGMNGFELYDKVKDWICTKVPFVDPYFGILLAPDDPDWPEEGTDGFKHAIAAFHEMKNSLPKKYKPSDVFQNLGEHTREGLSVYTRGNYARDFGVIVCGNFVATGPNNCEVNGPIQVTQKDFVMHRGMIPMESETETKKQVPTFLNTELTYLPSPYSAWKKSKNISNGDGYIFFLRKGTGTLSKDTISKMFHPRFVGIQSYDVSYSLQNVCSVSLLNLMDNSNIIKLNFEPGYDPTQFGILLNEFGGI